MSIRGFIGGLFRPRWPNVDLRSSEDWMPGDLAVCTGSNPWCDLNTGQMRGGPCKDDLMRVQQIAVRRGHLFLRFGRWPGDWFTARWFRKVHPDNSEACKPAFAKQMRSLGRKVEA